MGSPKGLSLAGSFFVCYKSQINMNNNEKKKESIFYYFLWWKVDKEELDKQVREYSTLGILKSNKGIASLLTLGSTLITALFAIFGILPFSLIYGAIVYLPLAFFINKGKRWAMIIMMVLWSIEKGGSLIEYILTSQAKSISSVGLIIFWWVLFMKYLFGAYKVQVVIDKTNREK